MSRFSIKLLTNLKVSSSLTVPAGQMWNGPLDDLPGYIRTMVEEKSPSIIVRELPEEKPVAEVPVDKVVEQPEKQEVKAPAKKTPVKRTTRKKLTK